MLRFLISLSLRHRVVVVVLAAILIVYGIYVTHGVKLDVFPEFSPPRVVIHTEAPGLSAEEVEALVTRPVETATSGVADLELLRSQSIHGLSVVTAFFRDGSDVDAARQRVTERLLEVRDRLPPGVETPKLAPMSSSTSLVLGVGLVSRTLSLMDLRTFSDKTLRPRLLGIQGVANVVEFGGEVRRLQVEANPETLLAHGIPLTELISAVRASTAILGTGFVETENQRITVRAEGQMPTPEQLAQTVIQWRSGGVVRVGDVATVRNAPAPKIGDAAINGQLGVLLLVWSQFGANTLEVTQAVEASLAGIEPTLRTLAIELYPRIFRPASFIETALKNIRTSLLLGGALVAVVLFLFLLRWRTAIISLAAIPLSLLTAVIVLDAWGVTINTLSLGGLVIALGEVVDDAIIDMENSFRRLRENRASGAPQSNFHVVLEASLEVRSSVVYATFIVAIIFVPILTLSGVQGKLFQPLGVAYILATLASLLVALTVTPALSLILLPSARGGGDPAYLQGLKSLHVKWLRCLSRHPGLVAAVTLLLCGGTVSLIPFFGGEFLPELVEGNLIVQMSTLPGTSTAESMRIGLSASKALLAQDFVESVSLQVGRAELGEDTAGTEFGEMIVSLRTSSDEEENLLLREKVRKAIEGIPGAKFAVLPFLEERIEETLSGSKAEVGVRLYGEDLDILDATALEVEDVLASIPGAADVQFQRSEEPAWIVRLRHAPMAVLGFRPAEVLEAAQAACQGTTVARLYESNLVFDLVVKASLPLEQGPERLQDLLVSSGRGQTARLGDLCDMHVGTSKHSIFHEGTRRYVEVACNVQGRDLSSFAAESKRVIAVRVSLPPGVETEFVGTGEAQARASREILLHSLLAGAAILLLLAMVFTTPRNLLLVLCNLPFALVGGVLAAYVTEGELSVGSLVGFVTLFGITTRNSIMMVSHFQHLVLSEGRSWNLETALRGASERLVPILMTALVTGLGLLPLALGSGQPGREIEAPMAIVILGGLLTSTTLNLLVLPVFATRLARFRP